MKTPFCLLATCAAVSLSPTLASAADLGGYYDDRGRYEGYEYPPYEERSTVIERAPIVRERYVDRRYVEPDEVYAEDEPDEADVDEGPEVTYYVRRYRQPDPYVYGGFAPNRFGPAFHHRRHVWRAHERW